MLSFLGMCERMKNGIRLSTRNGADCGFTMIELVMVIVIIGILAVVAAPKMNIGASSVSNGAELVASDIKATQLEAMSRHMQVTISIIGGSQTYTYGNGRTRNLGEVNAALTVSSATPITFNSIGEPVGATAVKIITVASGASTQTVTVQPYTGKVSTP